MEHGVGPEPSKWPDLVKGPSIGQACSGYYPLDDRSERISGISRMEHRGAGWKPLGQMVFLVGVRFGAARAFILPLYW